jgi:RNAse (barnase) inhibitor barstar
MVYELPGEQIHTLEDFYRLLGEAIIGPGGYFGSNLDALSDCLSGGFGCPGEEYTIRWLHSSASREALGYPETVRQLELRLARCHHTTHELVSNDLERARRCEGPTVFDWLVDIFRESDLAMLELCNQLTPRWSDLLSLSSNSGYL